MNMYSCDRQIIALFITKEKWNNNSTFVICKLH